MHRSFPAGGNSKVLPTSLEASTPRFPPILKGNPQFDDEDFLCLFSERITRCESHFVAGIGKFIGSNIL